MKLPRYSFSLPWMVAAAVALVAAANAADSENDEQQQQCMGKPPMESVATFLGMDLDYELADRICCNNHHFAEPKGYHAWPEVDFYAKLDPTKETVFYDSVCGIPLFVAPRGRTFDEFVEESLLHGWPSFRPAEMVSENVIIHPGGRMESKCLTHLGHNLPKDGVDRYCIDLVCMAGAPILAATGNNGTAATIGGTAAETPAAETPETETGTTDGTMSSSGSEQDADMDGILSASEFDPTTYESSAELNSGKHPKTLQKFGWAVGLTAALLLSMVAGRMYATRRQETRKKQDGSSSKQEAASLDEGTKSDNGGSV